MIRFTRQRLAFELIATLALISATTTAVADSLTVEILPKLDRYYAGQQVVCRIALELSNWEPDGAPSLNGIPVEITGVSVAPSDSPLQSVWIAPVTLTKIGMLNFSPVARGFKSQQIGFMRTKTNYGIAGRPFSIEVLPLPSEAEPIDFSGAVGEFALESAIDKTECEEGDLLNIRTTISGIGVGNIGSTLPSFSGNGFKSYPPNIAERSVDSVAITQVLVPSTTNACSIAPASFTAFNPIMGVYTTLQTQAFSVRVKQRVARELSSDDQIVVSDAIIQQSAQQERGDISSVEGLYNKIFHRHGKNLVSIGREATARIAPATSAKEIFTIEANSILEIRETYGDWIRILTPSGAIGWIQNQSIQDEIDR